MRCALLALTLAVSGCIETGAEDEDAMSQDLQQFAIQPWHMWGTEQVFQSSGQASATTLQLVRINYGRPETWRFLFTIRFPNGTPAGNLATILICGMFGVGRSVVTFDQQNPLLVLGPVSSQQPGRQWSRSYYYASNGDGTFDTAPIYTIVAQDVQVYAIVLDSAGKLIGYPVQISAQFAPNVHIRPDWFGGELHGQGGT